LIVEASVRQAESIIDKALQTATKEVQGVIGPHGAITRVQAGGINVSRGSGIQVYADGVSKTTIDTRGNVIIGNDITDPRTTTEIFFVEDAAYNGEQFSAGDFLIGNNSASNVKFDASEGQLQFRDGRTVQAYMDTDGSIKAGGGDVTIDAIGVTFENQQGILTFRDTAGNRQTISILSTADDSLYLTNEVGGKIIGFRTDTATHAVLDLLFREHASIAEAALLHIDPPSGQALLDIAGGSFIWAGRDGTETVFNDTSHDIDFRIESAANANAIKLDAGDERVTFFGTAGSALVTADNSTEKRLEIGNDHFIPTRDSSDKTVRFNEAGEDIDFRIEGDTNANLFVVDAGLDKVYVSGNELGYKFLPFGVYTQISPLTATGSAPYAASIDRSMTLAKWTQDYFIAGTSDGSNYWTVQLIIADVNNTGTVIASFTTGGTATVTWGRSTITSFSVNPVTTSYYNMFIYLTKTGAPGNIYFPGPLMEVSL
jgi:hypothetical protein